MRAQFFITVAKTPHLDGKHVVFGKVLQSLHWRARLRAHVASRRDLRLGHRVRAFSLNFARERSQADNSTVLAGGDGGVRALPRVRRLWLHSRPSTAPDGRGRAVTELPSAGVCGVGAGGDRRGQADGGGRHRRRHPLQARPHPRERRAVTPAPQPPPRDAARRAGGCARSMKFSYLVVLEVFKGVGA